MIEFAYLTHSAAVGQDIAWNCEEAQLHDQGHRADGRAEEQDEHPESDDVGQDEATGKKVESDPLDGNLVNLFLPDAVPECGIEDIDNFGQVHAERDQACHHGEGLLPSWKDKSR